MQEGDKIIYDGEECIIIKIYPQVNASPSGDILLEDNLGVQFLVNHSELSIDNISKE